MFDIGGGTAGELDLSDPSNFYGQIEGFTGADRIDLTNINFVSGTTTCEMSSVTIRTPSDVTQTDDALVDVSSADTDNLDGADAAQSWTINGAGAGAVDNGSLTLNGVLTVDAGAFQLAIKQQRKRDNADGRHGDRANGDLQAASIAIGAAVLFLIEQGNCTIAEAATYDGSSIAENDVAGALSNSDAALKFNTIAQISGALADGGAVEVTGGRLEIADTASATGVLKIDAGATLQLDGDRAVNVTLAGSTGESGSAWTFSDHAHGGAVVAHQNTGNHGPAAQSPDLSSQAASHAPAEIASATSNNGGINPLPPISAPNREPGNTASLSSEFATNNHPGDANTGNHGSEPQSLEPSSQAALQTPLEIPPATSDNGATNLSDSFNSPALPTTTYDIAPQAVQNPGPLDAAAGGEHEKDSNPGHGGIGESRAGHAAHFDQPFPGLPTAANDSASLAAHNPGPLDAAAGGEHGKDSNPGHDGIGESRAGHAAHFDQPFPALPTAANDIASLAAHNPGPLDAAAGGEHGKDSNPGHDGIGESRAGHAAHFEQPSPALPTAANDIASLAAHTPEPLAAAAGGEHGKDFNSGHDGIGQPHTGDTTHSDQPSPALPTAADNIAPPAAHTPEPFSAAPVGDHGKDSNFGHGGIGESLAGNTTHFDQPSLDQPSSAPPTAANDIAPQAAQNAAPLSGAPVGDHAKDQFAFDSNFGHDGESTAGHAAQFDQPPPALPTAANDIAAQAAQNQAPLSGAPGGDHAKDQFAFDSNFGHDGDSPAGHAAQFDQPPPAPMTAANDIAAQAGQNQAPLSAALAGDHAKDQFVFDSNFGHDGIGQSHTGNMTHFDQPSPALPSADQPIFQTVSDILAHTAEAHSAQAVLDPVAALAQNHQAVLTSEHKDKPSSDFIIHA